jgi:hypothetical protein
LFYIKYIWKIGSVEILLSNDCTSNIIFYDKINQNNSELKERGKVLTNYPQSEKTSLCSYSLIIMLHVSGEAANTDL